MDRKETASFGRDDNHLKINKVTASQDDDFAGVLRKNTLNKLALMEMLHPLSRRSAGNNFVVHGTFLLRAAP
jgi:hypothetical protein